MALKASTETDTINVILTSTLLFSWIQLNTLFFPYVHIFTCFNKICNYRTDIFN